MSFQIVDINYEESKIAASLNLNSKINNLQITDLIINDLVNTMYLKNKKEKISSQIVIYDNKKSISESSLTSTIDGQFSDFPYVFLTSNYNNYVNIFEFSKNPTYYPQVFKVPENCIITSLTFINNNIYNNEEDILCNVFNFNLSGKITFLFSQRQYMDYFNTEITPDIIPNITDNIYFAFSPSKKLNSLNQPVQIRMNITYHN
jgi:hypothetical protein